MQSFISELLTEINLDIPDHTKTPKAKSYFVYDEKQFPIYGQLLAGEKEFLNRYNKLQLRYEELIRSLLEAYERTVPSSFDIKLKLELVKKSLTTGVYDWITQERGKISDIEFDFGQTLLVGLTEPFTTLDDKVGDQTLREICETYQLIWLGLGIEGKDSLDRANTIRTMTHIGVPTASGCSNIDQFQIPSETQRIHDLLNSYSEQELGVAILTLYRCGDIDMSWLYLLEDDLVTLSTVVEGEINRQPAIISNERVTYQKNETESSPDFLETSSTATT